MLLDESALLHDMRRWIASDDVAMSARLRIVATLYRHGNMRLRGIVPRLSGVNPVDAKQFLDELEVQGVCRRFRGQWSLTHEAVICCRALGLVTDEEFAVRLRHASEFVAQDVIPRLPDPHVRHFEWRFSIGGLKKLAAQTYADAPFLFGESIGALNAPLFGLFAWKLGITGHISIYDRNEKILDLASAVSNDSIHTSYFDASVPATMVLKGQHRLVVMDPPWFPEFYARYVGLLQSIIRHPARIYALVQPQLTQPCTLQERSSILRTFLDHNFVLVDYLPESVGYQLNQFEQVTFTAQKLTVKGEWNVGDVCVMHSMRPSSVPPSDGDDIPVDEWIDYHIGAQVVSVKREALTPTTQEAQPRFTLACGNGAFPSLSAKDAREFEFNVWTSRNRVFATNRVDLVHAVCSTLQDGTMGAGGVLEWLRNARFTEAEAKLMVSELCSGGAAQPAD